MNTNRHEDRWTSFNHKRRLDLFLVVVLALGPAGCQSLGPTGALRAAGADSAAESPSAEARMIYHNNIGIALLEQFNHEKALEEFARCLAVRQDFLPAIVNSGLARFYLQQLDQSEEFMSRALSLNDRQPTALFAMGLIHKNQDRLELALESFRKILLQDPQDPPTLYQVGQILLKREEYDQAEKVLRQVVELSPYDTAAHYSLAMSLLRGGSRDEGQKVMQKFLGLRESGGMSSTGTQYGEQGKYMLATGEYSDIKDLLPQPPAADAETPVRFSEVGRESGLALPPAADRQPGDSDSSSAVGGDPADPARRRAARMGSGAAFGDYDADGDLDLYLARCGQDAAQSGGLLYRNDGPGRFEEVSRQAGIDHRDCGMGAYWGDLDNDGHTDLFLTNYGANRLYRNLGDGTFADVTAAAGVAGGDHWHLAAALADYDHDGDLDIYVGRFQDASSPPGEKSPDSPDNAKAAGAHLFRNNGEGVFTDLAESARVLAPGDRLTSVVFTDFDNRRDVDFWTVALGGPNRLYSNQRVGTFLDLGKRLDRLASLPAHSVTTADLDKDGRMDFLLGPVSGPLTWVRNLGRQDFQAAELAFPGISTENRSWNSHAFDYDNDGDLDVLEVRGLPPGASPKGSGLELYRNRGDGSFQAVTAESGLDRYRDRAFRSLTLGDYDNDGDTDFLLTVSGGRPLLFLNQGGNRNRWVKIRLKGTNSNKSGIGTKVEVKSGTLWQKVEVNGGSGYLSQSPPEVLFGLGQRDSVDALRLLWPGGVLQSETDLPVNRVRLVNELDRKGTSCPLLYTWDGRRYQFVTDFLGGCAIGYLLSPGRYNTPDTDEYIRIASSQLKAREGRYSLRINNQLEEVLYIDQAELLVLDHPEELELYPNERLMPGPPYPRFRIHAARGARPPVSARDHQDRDVLPLISRVDRKYPDGFRLLPFKGYAEEHSLVLDLGDLSDRTRVTLLMTAWIDYADSTANYQASQARAKLVPPYLQVKDPKGDWRTVIPQMGFPAGLPKTMVVDLSGKFLTDDYRVRIVTSMRIYWDRILVNTYAEEPTLRQHRLSPQSADLRFRGFPREYSPDGRRPLIYDYGWIHPTAPWKSHIGNYTRFGPVTELLHDRDDRYVIMRNGDEIHLDYDATGLPQLPQGWQRTFLLYADGFGKDMDPHSAAPEFVTPLPFHGMTRYPYGKAESYPDTPGHRRYLRQYNTRRVSSPFPDLRPVQLSRAK